MYPKFVWLVVHTVIEIITWSFMPPLDYIVDFPPVCTLMLVCLYILLQGNLSCGTTYSKINNNSSIIEHMIKTFNVNWTLLHSPQRQTIADRPWDPTFSVSKIYSFKVGSKLYFSWLNIICKMINRSISNRSNENV